MTDAVDDPASAPEGSETSEPHGAGTVAERLNRVTRYANDELQPEPPEPADVTVSDPPHAQHLEGAEQHKPVPAEEAPWEPKPAQAATEQPPAAMAEAPGHPPAALGLWDETAPAEEPSGPPQPFDDSEQDIFAPEATTKAPATLSEPTPEPAVPPSAAAPPRPAERPQEPPERPVHHPEGHQAALGEEARSELPSASAPRTDLDLAEPPAAPPKPATEHGEKLTVGRGIRLVAKLCECAELLVEGHLEATAQARRLLIAEGGRFIGSAEVDSAEIRGHFEGDLTVANRLSISATGSVAGTTRYQEIVIEAGGQVMGNAQRLPASGGTGGDGATS